MCKKTKWQVFCKFYSINMKHLFLIFFFMFIFCKKMNAQDNSPIQITEWVNPPPLESFSKPLIFIDFWATWCAPCIHSMSHTEILEKEYGENILFLYLSDETESKVAQFMKDKKKYFISGIDETGKNLLSLIHI